VSKKHIGSRVRGVLLSKGDLLGARSKGPIVRSWVSAGRRPVWTVHVMGDGFKGWLPSRVGLISTFGVGGTMVDEVVMHPAESLVTQVRPGASRKQSGLDAHGRCRCQQWVVPVISG